MAPGASTAGGLEKTLIRNAIYHTMRQIMQENNPGITIATDRIQRDDFSISTHIRMVFYARKKRQS